MSEIVAALVATSPAELLAVLLAIAYLLLAIRQSLWCWAAAIGSTSIYVVLMYDARLYMESALQLFYIAIAIYGWWHWRHPDAGAVPVGAASAANAGPLPEIRQQQFAAEATPTGRERQFPAEATPMGRESQLPAEATPTGREQQLPAEATPTGRQQQFPAETTPAGKERAARRARLPVTTWPLRHHALAITVVLLLSAASGWLLARHTDAALPYLDSFTTWGAVLATWMVARKLLENWYYWFVIDSAAIWLYLHRGLHLTAALFAVYLVLIVIGYLAWRRSMRQDGTAEPAAGQA